MRGTQNAARGPGALAAPSIALLAILLAEGAAQAERAPPDDGRIHALRQAVRRETDTLNRAARSLSRAGVPSERKLEEAALLGLAERRERAMLALFQASAEAALEEALPVFERDRLPEQVRRHIEQPATKTGTLEVLGVIAEDGGPGLQHRLLTGDRALRLGASLSDQYLSGTRLTVRGLLLADWLAAAAEGVTITAPVVAPETNGTFGTRYALIISVNFADAPAEPWTMEQARQRFDAIADWYLETSYEQMAMVSDVAGWFTIEASSTACTPDLFRTQAEAAARAAGFEPDNYNHVVTVFPRVASCGWAGLAQVPGRYAWLNNTIARSTAVHELGHNLGLLHSHSQRCSDDPLRGACATMEYGDIFDVMGSGAAEYHGSFRRYLGWIPASDVVSVDAQHGDVTAMLRSPETPYGTRVLQIQRATGDYLFVEAREAIGFDLVLQQYPAALEGVTVYVGPSFRSQSLVDIVFTTPSRADAPLLFGDTLADVDGDLSVTPLYNLDGDIYVQVLFGSSPR